MEWNKRDSVKDEQRVMLGLYQEIYKNSLVEKNGAYIIKISGWSQFSRIYHEIQ